MKKLFLLLFMVTSFLQAQTYQNPTFGTVTTKTSPTVTDDPYITTTGTTGVQGKISPVNLLIPHTPVNYSVPNLTIGAHLGGIDTRLGQISSTTAGITQRVYFTADNTTVNSVVYFASSLSGKGSTATGSPSALVLADNTKGYFTKDVISIAQPSPTIGYAGTYSGNLTVSATPTPVATQQRFTVEIYRTNNLGTPIASGVSGAPTGDLGVTVLAILDSGIINLSAGSITNVPVSGILTQNITINTGERLRYHVSAAKIGTGGGNVTFGVYYGTAYNSYYDVPVAITTDAVVNKSGVTGLTSTDALNTLNTNKANDSSVIHKSGDALSFTNTEFNPLLSQNATTLNVEKRVIQPESDRLPVANTTIVCWGDSLTAGAGGGGNTYPVSLSNLTNFTVINKGVGGITSTVIKNAMVADTDNYDKSVIIWAGRNNFTSPETVKADIATMISTLTHDRYLVMGVLNGDYPTEYKNTTNYNIIVQLNSDLKAIYGKKYVPIREFLVSLHDNTTQGLLDASRDIVPYNIRSDEIHLNLTGYLKVAEFVNQRLNILFNKSGDYFQSKDFDYYSKTYTAKNGISNQKIADQTADFRISGDGYADDFRPQNSLVLQRGYLDRWAFRNTAPEVGSVSGSNLVLTSYFDSGSLAKSDLITIFRFNDHFIYKSGTSNPVDRGVLFDIAGSFGANTISMFSPLTETADYPLLVWNSDTKGVRVYPVGTFAKNLLTGFTPTTGTITGTDTVLQGIQKNAGNIQAVNTATLHTSGNETFTGAKSAVNTGTFGVVNGLNLENSGTGDSRVVNILNSNTGIGAFTANTSLGIGSYDINNSGGVLKIFESSAGSTGDLTRWTKNLVTKAKVDQNGEVTAQKYNLNTGSNSAVGNAVLVAGTINVTTTAATTNSIVILTRKTSGGTIGNLTYTTGSGGITINSDSLLDTSTVSYLIIN